MSVCARSFVCSEPGDKDCRDMPDAIPFPLRPALRPSRRGPFRLCRSALLLLIMLWPAPTLVDGAAGQSAPRNGAEITGEVRAAGAEVVLELSNPGPTDNRVLVVITLGNDSEMKEAGRASVLIAGSQSAAYRLRGMSNGGSGGGTRPSFYILTIFRETPTGRRLIFYRHAPLGAASEAPPAEQLTLTAPPRPGRPVQSVAPEPPVRYENYVPPAEIQLEAQLLTGPGEPPTAILAFELFSERTLPNGTFEISLDQFRSARPVSSGRQLLVQFPLPADFDRGEKEPVVHYRLSGSDKRVLLEGDLPLAGLLTSDQVSLIDLQLDQPAYAAGSQVRMTLQLEGQPRAGFNIEISLRDAEGQTFHRDRRLMTAESSDPNPTFSLNLPQGIRGPVTIEYRLLDQQRGRLFDAGERDLPIIGSNQR